MERRNFFRMMLGVAAATALPSEIWPFKKIFLPATPEIIPGTYAALSRATYSGRLPVSLRMSDVTAVELEAFAKRIPELFRNHDALYRLFCGRTMINPELIGSRPQALVPLKDFLEDDYNEFDDF